MRSIKHTFLSVASNLRVMCVSYHQGLRTLELCVDNLQPDFLYDHIQPVRAELFQVCQQSCFIVSVISVLLLETCFNFYRTQVLRDVK